jgi:signal transduction histidine kinase
MPLFSWPAKSATITDVSLPDLLVALAWIGGGLAVWGRRTHRSAALMVWVGVSWLLGDAFQLLVLLHWGALAHLLVAYPTGRLESRVARVAVLIGYVAAVLAAVLPGTGWAIGFAIALPGATLVRFTTANGPVRRSLEAPLAAAIGVAAVLSAAAVMSADLLPAYELTLGVAALALAADLRIAPWSQAAITGIVVDLGRPADGMIKERLARAIGDPSLIIGYVVGDERPAVDEHGRPITLPEPGGGRAVTPVERDGRPLAVLVHDSASLGDPKLLADAASALSVTVANARLQEGLRSLMTEIAASTERLVDAARAQQRRLAAELLDQVVPPLGEAGRSLQNAGGGDLHQRLTALRRELMRFAQGLDPVALHAGGLAPALRALADGAGLPVTLTLADRRYPPEIETCAWFVCSEAIANALKHAQASQLSIRVAPEGQLLRVDVVDDGAGGAEPARGSGLRRLAERVAATGGLLTIDSGPGRGTLVRADFERGAGV